VVLRVWHICFCIQLNLFIWSGFVDKHKIDLSKIKWICRLPWLYILCMFRWSLFVLLYFFFLFIVLSVLLRYTDSDCPFGIFKLFLSSYTSVNNAHEMCVWMFSRLQILRKVHYSRLCFLGNRDKYEDCTSTPIYIRHTAKR
jgi:hypothetical protein